MAQLVERASRLGLAAAVSSTADVLAAIEATRPDAVVLLDDMPGLAHAETFAEVRSTRPEMPMTLMVGIGDKPDDVQRARVLGELDLLLGSDVGPRDDEVVAKLVPAVLTGPRLARRFAAATMARWTSTADLVARAELVASELVTNAVIHAHSPARISVSRRGGVARVAVTDWGLGELRGGPMPTERDIAGRGLLLVDSVSDRWGISAHLGERTVWCELPLPDTSAVGRPPTAIVRRDATADRGGG